MLKRALLLLPAVAVAVGLVAALPAPAQAAVARCNSNTSTGQIIYQITPPGSFTRYISAKVCLEYDSNSIRNNTKVFCRTAGGNGCDIRAEVLSAKLQVFTAGGSLLQTMSDDYFPAAGSGYSSGWGWQGTDNPEFACAGLQYQARDDNIRVRFAFDGVLRNVGSAWSSRGTLSGC